MDKNLHGNLIIIIEEWTKTERNKTKMNRPDPNRQEYSFKIIETYINRQMDLQYY